MEPFPLSPQVRSKVSLNQCRLITYNDTHSSVDIFWVDFDGKLQKYKKMDKKTLLAISTYKTHPWLVVNSVTKNRMLLDNQFLYMTTKNVPPFDALRHAGRTSVKELKKQFLLITEPLYSLKYIAGLKIRSYFQSEADVDLLEIPHDLKLLLKGLVIELLNIKNAT